MRLTAEIYLRSSSMSKCTDAFQHVQTNEEIFFRIYIDVGAENCLFRKSDECERDLSGALERDLGG